MNKRDAQKTATRNKIIDIAEKLFAIQGIVSTKTIDIAKAAGVAHGTLFSHFETRDILVETILNRKLEDFQKQFLEINSNQEFHCVINSLLDLLVEHEPFFSVVFRELSIVNQNLRNLIVYRFSIIELYVLHMFENFLSANGISTAMKPEVIIQHIFSLIIHYLNFREILNYKESIILGKKDDLIEVLNFMIYGGGCNE